MTADVFRHGRDRYNAVTAIRTLSYGDGAMLAADSRRRCSQVRIFKLYLP